MVDYKEWNCKFELNLEHSVSFASICEYSENTAYILAGNTMGDVFLLKLDEN